MNNWYSIIKLADLSDMLINMGVDPQVQEFISSLPDAQKQYYVNEIKKNPQWTLQDLQAFQMPEQQIDPYYNFEKSLVMNLPEQAQKWALVNLKQMRGSNLNYPEENLKSVDILVNHPELQEYSRFARVIERWIRTNGLRDMLRSYPNLDINSYTPDEIDEMEIEWHQVQAGKGEGKMYGSTDPALIVYGPEWKNPKYKGWTIQEVRTENDLLAEGNKQNHCVGSYCKDVEQDNLKIFSLRDPNNEPHVTIDTSTDLSEFTQIMGNSNSEPDSTYKTMIKEWVNSLRKNGIDPVYNDDQDMDEMSDVEHFLDNIGDNTDEYGFETNSFRTPSHFGHYKARYKWDDIVTTIIDLAKRENNYNRNGETYRGDITKMPSNLLAAATSVDETNNDKSYTETHYLMTSLHEEADKIYQNSWEDLYIEDYPPDPDPDSYEEGEDDDDYKVDLEEAEEQRQENRDEAEREYFGSIAETGLSQDTSDLLEKWAKNGQMPYLQEIYLMQKKKKKEEKAASNWYKRIA